MSTIAGITRTENKIKLHIYSVISEGDESALKNCICLQCNDDGFPELYGKYFDYNMDCFKEHSGDSWFYPHLLQYALNDYDDYFCVIKKKLESTQPTFVIKGL